MSDLGRTIEDTRMEARSIIERWPITDEKRKEIVDRLLKIIATSDNAREVTSAARALIAADKMNVDQQVASQKIDADDRRARLAQLAKRIGAAGVVVDAEPARIESNTS